MLELGVKLAITLFAVGALGLLVIVVIGIWSH